jgi:Fic family protein
MQLQRPGAAANHVALLCRLLFFLQEGQQMEHTALGAVQTARRLVTLFAADTRRTQAIGRGAANALRVLTALRQRPVLSLKQLCLTSAMTFPTAGKAMQHLVATGVARELTGQRRNRVFVYDAYLAILNEGGEPL